ncbi:MAG: PIN domain-containing protein, partial [Deltaproteobacteria bacterium]
MSVLYLDTSALVKLYVREKGSALTKKAVEAARLVATSRIAWVEAHSAFARRHREKSLSKSAFETARKALKDDWPSFLVVEFGERIALRAAQIV